MGEARSAKERIRYHAKVAARLTSPPQLTPPPGAPSVAVDAASVKAELERLTTLMDSLPEWGSVDEAIIDQLGLDGPCDAVVVREHLTVLAGQAIAARAEQIAGITAEEAREQWRQRLDAARGVVEQQTSRRDAARAELGWEEAEHARRVAENMYWSHPPRPRGDDEEVIASWEQRRETLRREADEAAARLKEIEEAVAARVGTPTVDEAEHVAWRIRSGTDDASKVALERLSEGYSKAIAEQRKLGGAHAWHEKSPKKAQVAFERGLAFYPSDWIELSGGIATPVVKVSKGRAHYNPGKVQKSKKRVPLVRHWLLGHGEAPDDWEPPVEGVHEHISHARIHWERRPDRDTLTDASWDATQYELYDSWRHRTTASGKPTGPGWEEFKYRYQGEVLTSWRRKRTRLETTEATVMPELTVGFGSSLVGEPGDRCAVHELAHRFEHAVPEIGQLESAFIMRRTTDPDGTRHKLVSYHGSKREKTRPDSFADVYIGKDYDDHRFHEVLSVGMESLFAGSSGGLVGIGEERNADTDHRAFVLGVLATAGRPQAEQ